MQENKTAWAIAVVVILVAAGFAWWYVAGVGPQSSVSNLTQEVAAPVAAPTAAQGTQSSVVVPVAPDSTGVIQNDLDAVDAGSADFQKDVDTLGADIQSNL